MASTFDRSSRPVTSTPARRSLARSRSPTGLVEPALAIAEIDLGAGGSVPLSCDGRIAATADGAIDGVLLCWEATLSPGNTLSTVPGAANLDSSWRVQLLSLPQPVAVRAGDLIAVSIERRRPPRVSCVVTGR